MAQGAHKITEQFEQELCKYTGAPYCVAVDNCSNALFLALYYELRVKDQTYSKTITRANPIITIPSHTYPSVPCEIIHAKARVKFEGNYHWFKNSLDKIKGSYQLHPTRIWDSSLSFTYQMYKSGQIMCLSFTGPYKHLKLGKGGAILTDDINAYAWFKRARFSGRQECSYFEDDFDSNIYKEDEINVCNMPSVLGWNFYMMPEIAARGIQLMQQFYDREGNPKSNEDIELHYPDLSKFKIFQQWMNQ